MGLGKAVIRLALLVPSSPAFAEELASFDAYLACSVEVMARTRYVLEADMSDTGHVQFMAGRAGLLLAMAEFVQARDVENCRGPDRIWRGPTRCDPDESVRVKRDRLADVRLDEIVALARGTERLPVCIEDDLCAACMNLLADVDTDPGKE
ncbi:MAG: hypothetical protein JNK34_00125 [Tabrizicola sp.]|nr:hypothetical protein [Tabrizicola sp.]